MSNQFDRLPRQATAVLLTLLLTLAPLPAEASNYHWSGWHERDGCEWYGYHNYDEVQQGHVYGRTNGRHACAEVFVRVHFNDTWVENYDVGRVVASANTWEPDFGHTFHAANPVGPTAWTGFRLW